MKVAVYGGCAALAVFMSSCGVVPGRAAALKKCEKLVGLNPAKAAQDALRAKAAGDARLLGAHGYSDEYPGVSGDAMATTKAHGVRMIEGTSDAIPDMRCEELNKSARDYAAKYNRAISPLTGRPI
jgi:hypothetical protein